MSKRSVTNYLKLNQNLRSDDGEFRFMRLPRLNPLPKFQRPALAKESAPTPSPGATRRPPEPAGTIIDGSGSLPEMTGDLIDADNVYTVSNVRRADGATRGSWSKFGFSLFVGKVTGGQRAARL